MGFCLFYLSFYIFSQIFRGMYCYRNVTLNSFKLLPGNRINNLYNSCYSGTNRSYLNRFQESNYNRQYELFSHTDSTLDRNPVNLNSENFDLKNKYKLLYQVNSLYDLKRIPEESLPELCNEVRSFLGDVISKVGGHFSGSLGVTELTVALHYVFNSPFDKIVWDIGHQAYVHKILTGRRDQLCTIKQKGGLSGFCRIYESIHDIFGAGHSSTSISSLQGILEGYMLSDLTDYDNNSNNNKEDRKFVCVIGDGGMTGGMAYESLNYAVNIKSPLIVVYNDNEQVSLPTGMKSIIGTKPVVPFFLQESSKKQVKSSKEAIKDLFEKLDKGEEGLNIIGPIDGHNLEDLLYLFKQLKYNNSNNDNNNKDNMNNKDNNSNHLDYNYNNELLNTSYGLVQQNKFNRIITLMGRKISGPLIVHIKTVKGYCCPEALQQLDRMHSIKPNTNLTIVEPNNDNKENNNSNDYNNYNQIGMNEPERSEFEENDYNKFDNGSYGEVFANTLIKMAKVDDKIVAVTAAMPGGTCVGNFGSFFPNRTFDVGICEQHAVTFCGGLTLSGMKPYCALYSTFIQRGFDQVIHDIVIQNLPVRFVLDRAGYVGEDGLSHHGNYDLNFFRVFKNVITMAPSNQIELALMLQLSSVLNQPSVIRYPKDKVPNPSLLNYYPTGLYDHVKYYLYLNDNKDSKVDSTTNNTSSIDSNLYSNMSFDKEWKKVLDFKSKVVKRGKEVAILCLGPILYDVLKAVERLGIDPTVVDMRFLNPLDVSLLKELELDHKYLITVEESVSGGLSTSVLEYLADSDKLSLFKVKSIKYPYEFVHHATRLQQKELAQIDSRGIETQITSFLNS